MDKLISIIVPVYNAEQTLSRCIEALLEQTYKNIEIILVNDGSADSSLSICKQYATMDNRITIINKSNGGVSSARNAGLDLAKGYFVMFCDSDDWPEKIWCETLISYFEDNSLIMCGTYIEGEQNYIPSEVKAVKSHPFEKYSKEEYPLLTLNCFNAPWNKIFTKKIIDGHSIRFNEKLTNGEDLLFVLKYLSYLDGAILFLDTCVFHYSWPTTNTLSVKVPENYLDQCELYTSEMELILKSFPEMNSENKKRVYTEIFNQYYKGFLYWFKKTNIHSFQKIKNVNKYMSGQNYQKIVKNAFISKNIFFSLLARRKNCLGLYCYNKIKKVI